MPFMQLQIFRKGATYTADCAKCGTTLYSHEWFHVDHNERRDAMRDGTLQCDHCSTGRADPETFQELRPHYAGWYSAPGFMDCTEPMFDTNRRRLERDLRDIYEPDEPQPRDARGRFTERE